jgi:hypothetical protein
VSQAHTRVFYRGFSQGGRANPPKNTHQGGGGRLRPQEKGHEGRRR